MPTLPPNAHLTPYRVCYADTDCMGRVYYANYFVFFERARTDMLRALGFPYSGLEAEGCFLPVRGCHARYWGYARYDDELELHTWVSRLRRATITFVTGVRRKDEQQVLVQGTVELACVSAEGKPAPLPVAVARALEPYVYGPDSSD